MIRAIIKAREAIENLYKGLCTIYEFKDVEDDETGETTSKLVPVHKDIPCKLSKKTISSTSNSEITPNIKYEPMLFINPDIEIKAGSQIVVEQNGVIRKYKRSGEPFIYTNHQEIVLQRIDTA